MIKRQILFIYLVLGAFLYGMACTSAIIGADMNPYGRPLLWKHRDTGEVDNKVAYIEGKDGEYPYVGLFNSSDKNFKEVWIGMNNKGFAVMNTASYNLKDDKVPQKDMDKEGILMDKALKSCVTVDDFEKFLEAYPKPLGVEANFGVIDAYGNGAYFETNNHSFTRFNLADSPDHVLVRTNYSHSGRKNEGYGFIREANANHLLAPYIAEKNITPEVLTETLSRSFWHSQFNKDFIAEGEEWAVDQDFIPRYKSSATVVIEGIAPLNPGDEPDSKIISDQYIMWTGLGYPPCSEIVPVWCKPGGVDEVLLGTGIKGHSEMSDKVKARRDDVFSLRKGNKDKYVNLKKLHNEQNTGYIQVLVPQNLEVYRKIRERRDNLRK